VGFPLMLIIFFIGATEYGCEIWGGKYMYYPVLERIPLRFCIDMLGLPFNASNVAVYGETGTYPQ